MYSLKSVIHSEVGRVRKNNQDSGYASSNLILVADGMGGAAAGDLASAVAVTELAKADRRLEGTDMLELLAGALDRANDRLSDLILDDPSLDGMGTTVCGALFSGTQFGLVHIGDSRCYLLRDGVLTQITHDHSWVQSLIDQGKLTPEQAESHPHRSLLMRVLNGQPQYEPVFELIDAELGDRIMFCSDGLSGMVSEEHLGEVLGITDIEVAVEQLAAAANAAGGFDNITLVVADVVEFDEELEKRPSEMVGAAIQVDIPAIGAPAPSAQASITAPTVDAETARYTPQPRKFRWLGTALILALVTVVLAGSIWGLVAFTRTKYFVGVSDGHVATFQGVPGDFFGLRLNQVVEDHDIKTSDLPKFYQSSLERGITVADRQSAKVTVSELRSKAQRCITVRAERAKVPVPTVGPPPAPTDPSGLPPAPETVATTSSPSPTSTPGPSNDSQEC